MTGWLPARQSPKGGPCGSLHLGAFPGRARKGWSSVIVRDTRSEMCSFDPVGWRKMLRVGHKARKS